MCFLHPAFRREQQAFQGSGVLDAVDARAVAALVRAAASTIGYAVDVTAQPRPMITHDALARVSVGPETAPTVDIRVAGLQSAVDLGVEVSGFDAPDVIEMVFGRRPERVVIYDNKGPVGDWFADAWSISGVPVGDRSGPPPPPE